MDRKILKRLEALNQIKLDDAQENDVLAFFAKREAEFASLDKINTAQAEPMVHVMPTAIALREDVPTQPFTRQELQAQAQATDAGYFCVPRVIEG